MNQYVVGFLFSADLERVVLIRKNKPDWQAGLLNGVGGKVEAGESFYKATVREFQEETGAVVTGWTPVARLCIDEADGSITTVEFSAARGDFTVKSTTDEAVDWYSVNSISERFLIIPNLRWLVPLARQKFISPNWKEGGTLYFN